MTWKKKTATAASTMLLAAAGMMATASPAAADGTCPANRVCVWDQTGFGGNRIASGSTNSCFAPSNFTFGAIKSYDNNLSVDAKVWKHYYLSGGGNAWVAERTLVAGGFSSNIGVAGLGAGPYDLVCMGNATP